MPNFKFFANLSYKLEQIMKGSVLSPRNSGKSSNNNRKLPANQGWNDDVYCFSNKHARPSVFLER